MNKKWFYCKYCGTKFESVVDLTGSCCCKNPYGKNHALYEGEEKEEYTCRYCGKKAKTLADLSVGQCPKNLEGHYHEPLEV